MIHLSDVQVAVRGTVALMRAFLFFDFLSCSSSSKMLSNFCLQKGRCALISRLISINITITFISKFIVVCYDLTAKNNARAKECYVPSRGLKNTLTEMLLFQQRSEQRQKKILRGEKLSQEEIKEEEEEFQARRKLDKRKSDILTQHVFPSMANVVVFFQFASHPLLRAEFDKDLQALLFGVQKSTMNILEDDKEVSGSKYLSLYTLIHDRNVFSRLITGILALSEETEMTDFRYILCDILQREMWDLIRRVFPMKFKDKDLFHKVIMPDMARASAWISFLSLDAQAASAKTKFNAGSRPVLF
jgi:hypothetical protein